MLVIARSKNPEKVENNRSFICDCAGESRDSLKRLFLEADSVKAEIELPSAQ